MKRLIGAVRGLAAITDANKPLRIAVVVSHIVDGDGTSNAVRDTIRALSTVAQWNILVFTHRCAFPEIPVYLVDDPEVLARHPQFTKAEVVVYHFGFYEPLFDVVSSRSGHARQIVFFHNITPAEFLPEWLHPDVARSFEQLRRMAQADRWWPLTTTNAKVLIDAGVQRERIAIVNPVVEWPPTGRLADKKTDPIRILFVGRMIQSKGVLDLMHAVALLRSRTAVAFRLSLVGTPSDEAYVAAIRARAESMRPHVELLGRVERPQLEHCYREAHILAIPSYHEGFCRPVAEGLRAGCIPVGYASHHLPVVANGLGQLVAPGDIDALADALRTVVESIGAALAAPRAPILPLDRGKTSVRRFDRLASRHAGEFGFGRLVDSVVGGIQELVDS